MTVSYTREVASCRGISPFVKLLRRWRGSIYKLVYGEVVLFIVFYYGLNLLYKFALNDLNRNRFEKLVNYCNSKSYYIPLSFVLGFYVTIVMTRWWNQYSTIPCPDSIALYVSTTIQGQHERGRVMRRTIMRYICLSSTMLFTDVAIKVKKRFPTLDHFINAGLLEESEKNVIEELNKKFPTYSKYWLPLVWAASIVTRARKEGLIHNDLAVNTLLDAINEYRGKAGLLSSYDHISIPLVYTQVVTLAVYTYFITTLIGQQPVKGQNKSLDMYFPFFTLLNFFFYMGWLKVAESLINPFGDDDDDFELNWMVDRNLKFSYLVVDEMHHEHPELIKDQYWDEVVPPGLPYTVETEFMREMQPLPSTANITSKNDDEQYSMANQSPSFNRNNSVRGLLQRFLQSDSLSSDTDEEMLQRLPSNVIQDVIDEVDEKLAKTKTKSAVMDIFEEELPKSPRNSYVIEDSFENLKLKREEDRLKQIKEYLINYLKSKQT